MGGKATDMIQIESPAVALRGNFLIPWSGKQKGMRKIYYFTGNVRKLNQSDACDV